MSKNLSKEHGTSPKQLRITDLYDAKREIKEFIYRELGLQCISIEAHEDHNIPMLKKNLIKKLRVNTHE